MKIYISGPMRGLKDLNFPAFFKAEEFWTAKGWNVANPARMDMEIDGPTTEENVRPMRHYIQRDVGEIVSSDAVCLLPGWRNSRGATMEALVGEYCDLDFYNEKGERINVSLEIYAEEWK